MEDQPICDCEIVLGKVGEIRGQGDAALDGDDRCGLPRSHLGISFTRLFYLSFRKNFPQQLLSSVSVSPI